MMRLLNHLNAISTNRSRKEILADPVPAIFQKLHNHFTHTHFLFYHMFIISQNTVTISQCQKSSHKGYFPYSLSNTIIDLKFFESINMYNRIKL